MSEAFGSTGSSLELELALEGASAGVGGAASREVWRCSEFPRDVVGGFTDRLTIPPRAAPASNEALMARTPFRVELMAVVGVQNAELPINHGSDQGAIR